MSETSPSATPDPRRLLTPPEVAAAGLEDWAVLAGRLKARFVPADYATGLAFVARVGAAAEEADHHPELTLTYTEVVIALASHDVGGVTSRDVRLARRISGLARELGLRADVAGVSHVELALDTARGTDQARIYTAMLASRTTDDGLVEDPALQSPTLWWQGPDSGGTPSGHPLPAPEVEQRWHLDVWVAPEAVEARLQAVLDAGGTLLSDAAAPSFWVVEDADGNRSCLCTVQERETA